MADAGRGRPARGRLAGEPGARRGRPRHALVRQRQRDRPRRRDHADQAERRAVRRPAAGAPGRRRARRRPGRRRATCDRRRTRRPTSRSTGATRRSAASSTPTRPAATAWAQAGRPIPPFGTTHADHFHGAGPGHPPADATPRSPATTRRRPGAVIVETLDGGRARRRSRCRPSSSRRTARSPGAATRARRSTTPIALELVAAMASRTLALDPDARPMADAPPRPPLPAQARRRRLLRAAPAMTDGGRLRRGRPAPRPRATSGSHREPVAAPGAGRGPASGSRRSACAARICTGIDEGEHRRRAARAGRSSSAMSSPASIARRPAGRRARRRRSGRSVRALRAVPRRRDRTSVSATRFAGFTARPTARSARSCPGRGACSTALPDAIGDDEATLLEPLGVALHAARPRAGRGRRPGRRLRLRPARAPAHPAPPARRAPRRSSPPTASPIGSAAAGSLGATHGVVVGERDRPASRSPRTPATSRSTSRSRWPATTTRSSDAIAAVRPGGRVVLVGIPDGDRTTLPGRRWLGARS